MNERNKRLGADILDLISNITAAANSTNPDATKIGQLVTSLDNDLAEAVTVRIDQTARNNATVGALAIENVLDETVEDYGKAWGADSETVTSATANETAPKDIVNVAAYQTAQGLAAAAQNMFNDLKAKAQTNATSSIDKLDKGLC